jgi:H/ACA ribonucleoprotein complex subunit 4
MDKKDLLEFGIINIDKPAGCTSFDVVAAVRDKLKLQKAGHFGTLDPMVTGVLPIALNRACKLTSFFIHHDKEYVGEMRIHEDIDLEKIEKMIAEKFTGKIIQLPPVKSRVKRQEREREIFEFEILEKKGQDLKFIAEVQGGTYIRKLVHDLGQELGVGAHMTKLRRTRAGIFEEKDSVKLEEVDGNLDKIQPAEELIKKIFKSIQVKDKPVEQLLTGKPVHYGDLVNEEKSDAGVLINIFNGGRFIGVYQVVNEGDIFAKAEFVKQDIK